MTDDERAAIERAIYHILAGYNLHSRSGMISELVDALSPLLAAKNERVRELEGLLKECHDYFVFETVARDVQGFAVILNRIAAALSPAAETTQDKENERE